MIDIPYIKMLIHEILDELDKDSEHKKWGEKDGERPNANNPEKKSTS